MAVYVLTVAGVTKAIQEGSIDIRETANGRNLMTLDVKSLDGTYRPAMRAEVILTEDGTRIFGGNIDAPSEQGIGKGSTGSGPEILAKISASDFNALADRRYVTEEIPAGTLKAALLVLEPYLAYYSVTLNAGQAIGPALPALSYLYRKLTDVLAELSALTNYEWTWNIDYNKSWQMVEIGTVAAPFNVTESNRTVEGDITVEPSTTDYANYIIFLAGTGTRNIDFERHDGDGVTRTFVLDVPAIALIGALRIDGGVGGLPVGVYGVDVMEWTFDAATNAIIQDPAYPVIAVGHYIEMSYTGQFPLRVTADGGAAPADLVEKTYANDAVFDRTVAQALADAFLARDMSTLQTVKYRTAQVGIHPGQIQTITSPKRNLSGSFLVTDVQITTIAGHVLRRDVTAVSGSVIPASWRETVKQWSSGAGASSAAASVTIVSAGGVGGSGTAGQYAVWATTSTLTGVTTIPETAIADGAILARLAANEIVSGAWSFTSAPFIATTEPALYFYETDQGVNLKAIRFDLQAGVLQIQSLTDAFSVQSTLWTLTRATGAMAVLGGITAGSGAVGIVDATGKIPAISSTYFASLSGANLTGVDLLGSVNTHTVAGIHTWIGASATTNRLHIENITSGATAAASLRATAGTTGAFWIAYSQGWTTSGSAVQASGELIATGAGGVSVTASNAAGDVRIYSRNTLAATFGASSALTLTGAMSVTGVGTFTTHVLPATSDTADLGRYDRLWNQAYISQLNAVVFALSTQTLFGGYSTIGKQAGSFASAIASGDVAMDFGQAMTTGDFVEIRATDTAGSVTVEYVTVGTVGAGTVYAVTRNLSGGGAKNWASGTPFLVNGASGDGRINLYAYDGKPRMVTTLQGATYNAQTPQTVVGNLNGYYGYVTDVYGLGAGTAAAVNVTVDATNGFRIRSGTTNKFVADTSGNLSIVGDLAVGTAGVIRSNATAFGTGTGYWLAYNAGTPQFRVGTVSGNRISWDGTDLVAVSATVSIGSTGITLSGAGSSYVPGASYKFAAGAGLGGTSDEVGLESYLFTSSPKSRQIVLRNLIEPTTPSDDVLGLVKLDTRGWNGTGAAASNYAYLEISSGSGSFSSNASAADLTADTIAMNGAVTTASTFRTGLTADATAYTQSNDNLLAGDNVEALGIAGTSTAVNLNMYLKGVAARKAALQAVVGGTNGGNVVIFVKPDSGSDVAEALRLSEAGALKLAAYTAATFAAGDKYLVIDASGNVHRSALGPAS